MSHQVIHTMHPGIGPNPAKRRRHQDNAADKSACQEPSAALPAHEHLPAENANDCPDLVACRALLVADIRATIVRLKPTDARALHVIWQYLPSAPGGQHDTPVLRLRLQCRRRNHGRSRSARSDADPGVGRKTHVPHERGHCLGPMQIQRSICVGNLRRILVCVDKNINVREYLYPVHEFTNDRRSPAGDRTAVLVKKHDVCSLFDGLRPRTLRWCIFLGRVMSIRTARGQRHQDGQRHRSWSYQAQDACSKPNHVTAATGRRAHPDFAGPLYCIVHSSPVRQP